MSIYIHPNLEDWLSKETYKALINDIAENYVEEDTPDWIER